MDFELDDEQRAWVAEVRQFLDENVTAALRAEMAEHGLEYQGGELTAFRRKIGEKGWFGLNWPKEYGGLGLTAMHQHLLMSEFEYVGVPGPDLTVTSVAPMIMRHGTEQNKKEFLPGVARGEIVFALGYSEPNAGTDLASLRTRAVRDGDEWVINGVQDLEQRGPAVHPRMVVRAHRPGRAETSRNLGDRGPHRQPGHRDPPAVRLVGLSHQRDVLPRRARAGHQPGR